MTKHRGALSTTATGEKRRPPEYQKSQELLNNISSVVLLNNDPDVLDSTGIQNYVHLSYARPVIDQNHQVLDS